MERTVDVAWGEHGMRALAQSCDVLVIVDVLSFTTCVSIAVSHGASIVVAHSADEAAALADGAEVATRRTAGGRYTLANVAPACRSCNASKWDQEVTGWLRRRRLDEPTFLLRHLEISAALVLRFAEDRSEGA